MLGIWIGVESSWDKSCLLGADVAAGGEFRSQTDVVGTAATENRRVEEGRETVGQIGRGGGW
jgi:hypothetical protein